MRKIDYLCNRKRNKETTTFRPYGNTVKPHFMMTKTINSEDLAKKLVVSFKYNTTEEHRAVASIISMIAGEEMYEEVCEIAKKMMNK